MKKLKNIYKYKIINENNTILKGKLLSHSIEEAFIFLKNKNYLVICIKKMIIYSYFNNLFSNKCLNKKDLLITTDKFYYIFSSPMTISQGLVLMTKDIKNKKLKNVFSNINECISKGMTVSNSFDKQSCFPEFYIQMLKVGDATGRFAIIFNQLSNYYEKTLSTESELKTSMIYPMLVFVMMTLVIAFALIKIIPMYSNMYKSMGAKLPLPTVILVSISNLIINNTIICILILIFLVVIILLFTKTKTYKKLKDLFFTKVFFIRKVYLKLINYRISSVLAILNDSGINIIESITILRNIVENDLIKKDLDIVIINIKNGRKLSDSFISSPYFDLMFVSLLRVGEESGYITESLNKCSEYLNSELVAINKRINKLIEPSITIILGIIIFLLILAIMSPIFVTNISFF